MTVTIAARAEYGKLAITVSDDGPGGVSDTESHGIGLANVRDRLAARFGDEASLVSAPDPQGYRSVIRMPLTKHHDSKHHDLKRHD